MGFAFHLSTFKCQFKSRCKCHSIFKMPVLNTNIIVFTHGITQYRNHTICELWFAPGVSWTVQKRQKLERQRKIIKRKGALPIHPQAQSRSTRRSRGQRTLSPGRPRRAHPSGRQAAKKAGTGLLGPAPASCWPRRRALAGRSLAISGPVSLLPTGPPPTPGQKSDSQRYGDLRIGPALAPGPGWVGDPEQPGRGRDGHS